MSTLDLAAARRALLLPRAIEERMLVLLRQGRLSKWFSGIGQEAIAVGVTAALRPDDWILPMHRNVGVFTTRGVELDRLLRQLLGRDGGFTAGRDRSFHFGSLPDHLVGMISHLGAMLPVACGLGLAAQLDGTERVAAAFTGDGATSEGDFHEALNLAAVWRLPVLFVVENNQYGLSTPVAEQFACATLADRGPGYGVPGVRVDGNDLDAVYRAVTEAAARARAGEGPTLLECVTFRMRGHEEASGTAYVPDELFERWAPRDPLRGEAPDPALRERVADAADRALAAPAPDSTAAAELAGVHAPSGVVPAEGGPPEERRYLDAVSDGLDEALRRYPDLVLMGQDIAEYGGVFKITQGFADRYGRERIRNTPIVESAAIGAAMGLALAGRRAMVEMQFADFVSCGFNQIVNNLAKTHYRWGAALPVVVRLPYGGGMGAGPFHSQCPEAWFAHVPGLRIYAPSTPADAKGLLLAAFEDGNPTLFLEHKALYRGLRGPVPSGWHVAEPGRARVVRPGTGATVVTYGAAVHWACEAAEALAADGHSVEVVDLRTLLPWDREGCAERVRRTGRALVLHEAPLTGGFGAEVAASLQRDCFEWLDAPVERLAGLDTPVPFSPALEAIYSPRGRITGALRELLAY